MNPFAQRITIEPITQSNLDKAFITRQIMMDDFELELFGIFGHKTTPQKGELMLSFEGHPHIVGVPIFENSL